MTLYDSIILFLQYNVCTLVVLCRYEVGRRKIRNKKEGEMSKLKYKVKKERKVSILNNIVKLSCNFIWKLLNCKTNTVCVLKNLLHAKLKPC